MSTQFDFIILGQGLAGTALAWSLHWLGAKVLVVDRQQAGSSSKIAAGLITPITGQKLIRSWRFSELWPVATSFYERVQRETDADFFRQTSMVRLFVHEKEKGLFSHRLADNEFRESVSQLEPRVNLDWFNADDGGFEMREGGQLDVVTYLSASQRHFNRHGGYVASNLNLPDDVQISDEGVLIPRLDVGAKALIFCQGIDASDNPWFRNVQFKPAKGEILTVRVPRLEETRVIHRGVWLAPLGNELFKTGATYDWRRLDSDPTPQGRDDILNQLRQFLRLDFEVVAHEAAVRPIHRNQYPVLGTHPQFPQLVYFNGLGSKGALHSPFFAMQMAKSLMNCGEIDASVNLNRKTQRSGNSVRTTEVDRAFHVKRERIPLTQQAQLAIRSAVSPGDSVVDATMGNGHDTQFLAELVGPGGTVFAFDTQQMALENTTRRLTEMNLSNVVMINQDHARLAEFVPKSLKGQIAAVMFNLGYLPGGDKQITTSESSTGQAIEQAIELLRPQGVITVLAYTGHDGGTAEAMVVQATLSRLSQQHFLVEVTESQPGKTSGPRMFAIKRLI